MDDDYKQLRRQYFGALCAARVIKDPRSGLADADVRWAWETAGTMASRALVTEGDEAAAARAEAQRLPLR